MSSLSTFSSKYGPGWAPRYVVLDAAEFVAAQALVMANAEGVTELPLIGRFLGQGNRAGRPG
jgi:lysyl-tRNA synthetase class 2